MAEDYNALDFQTTELEFAEHDLVPLGNPSRGFAFSRPQLFRLESGCNDAIVPYITGVRLCRLRESKRFCVLLS